MAKMGVVRAATGEKVGEINWRGTEQKGTFEFDVSETDPQERAVLVAQYADALAYGRKHLARILFRTFDRDYVYGFEGYWGTAMALSPALRDHGLDIDFNDLEPPEPARAAPPRGEFEVPEGVVRTDADDDESTATV